MAASAAGRRRREIHPICKNFPVAAAKGIGISDRIRSEDGLYGARSGKKDAVDQLGALPNAVTFPRSNPHIKEIKLRLK